MVLPKIIPPFIPQQYTSLKECHDGALFTPRSILIPHLLRIVPHLHPVSPPLFTLLPQFFLHRKTPPRLAV